MWKNNLKIAFRALRKNKIYTGINILGLTVGIAAALLIFRMVTYELSFNKNFENYDRIARVVSIVKNPADGDSHSVCTPVPAMEEVKQTVSQFEYKSRIRENWSNITVPNPNGGPPLKKFSTDDSETAFFVDAEFPKIFDFAWLAGDKNTALVEPSTIVLTQTWAEKCFDDWTKAMNKTVLIDNLIPVTVTGVVEDMPQNCDFTFPYLVSYQTVENNAQLFFYNPNWGSCSSNDQIYALVKDMSQTESINKTLAKVGAERYTDESGQQRKFHLLQPLSDIHYNEDYGHSGDHQTSKSRLKVLGFIGLLILIIACFNFINLATAQASLRAKEVGVRKTLGGRPSQLIGQFMSETGLIVLFAVTAGTTLAYLFSPFLKYVSDVPDELPFIGTPEVWLFLGVVTVLVTLLAGLYPSMTLASYKPVEALKSRVSHRSIGGVSLRKSLVVFQFVIAQVLIIGAMITINQLDYIGSRDLGFSKDLIYSFGFNADSTTIARQAALKQNLLQIPTVDVVSFNSDPPLSGNTWSSNFRFDTRPEDEKFHTNMKLADSDYQKAYDIKLAAGRWLAPSDTMREVIINETMLRKLGLTDADEAIGKTIGMGRSKFPIVGVAKDFHTHSLRQEHQPLVMSTRREYYWEAALKIRPSDLKATTTSIQAAFDKVLPEQVFVGEFFDENLAQFYEDDARLSATCKGFGLLAILISCLGLFGLATHAATQRIKEIGVRKVLGASVGSIIGLLSKDFLKLVMIALFLAAPLAYYFMNSWLDNFAYRIDISWSIFVLAGLLAMLIAFLTVGFQSVKAALVNPVESLKNE